MQLFAVSLRRVVAFSKLGMAAGLLSHIGCILHIATLTMGMAGASAFLSRTVVSAQPYIVGASLLVVLLQLARRHRSGQRLRLAHVLIVTLGYLLSYLALNHMSGVWLDH